MSITHHHNKIIGLLLVCLALGGCWPANDNGTSVSNGNTSGGNTTSSGIDATGGTVNGYYSAKVLIPAGALATNTDIAITRDSSGAPDVPTSGVVRYLEHELTAFDDGALTRYRRARRSRSRPR